MTASPLVVDASAIVQLLLDRGPDGDVVAEQLSVHQLIAPHILPIEVTNAIRRLRNRELLTEDDARDALAGLWSLSIELWPFEPTSRRAWELGRNLTTQHAAYAALAELAGALLLTADRRLAAAPGPTCPIVLV